MGFGKSVLGLYCLALLSGCSGLLYHPTKVLHYDPARLKLTPEEVHFTSANGAKLFGWFFRSQSKLKAKATVVHFHGNAENLSSHYLHLTWILKEPFDLFVFDYQGYGRSEGSPSPEKTVQDGLAALEWVRAHMPGPIIVFGQSLGGAIALRTMIEAKGQFPVKLLAVDSTFPSFRSMGRQVLSRGWLTWPLQWIGWLVMSDAWAPVDRIHEISPIPMLVIHGDKDSIVDIENGRRVFAEAREPKEFWEIRGGGHTDVFTIQPDSYKKRFVEKINQALGMR